jgi:hypothetical protein
MADQFDEMKDKAADAAGGEKGAEGVDKAAEMADEKTGGKYSEQVEKGADTAKHKLGEMGDDQ